MTNKEAIMRALSLVRNTVANLLPETDTETKDCWKLCETIVSNAAGIFTARGPLTGDTKWITETICDHCIGISFEDAGNKFVSEDKTPMTDEEFHKWFNILWDATWKDDDKRFKDKTVGEMWEILIKEDHFPKERFYNELNRRGMFTGVEHQSHDAPNEPSCTTDTMKLVKTNTNLFRMFVNSHRWACFEISGFDGLLLRSYDNPSIGAVEYGQVLKFNKVNGTWFIAPECNNNEHAVVPTTGNALISWNYDKNRKKEFIYWIQTYGWDVCEDEESKGKPLVICNLHNPDSKIVVRNNDTIGAYRTDIESYNAGIDNSFEMVALVSCSM